MGCALMEDEFRTRLEKACRAAEAAVSLNHAIARGREQKGEIRFVESEVLKVVPILLDIQWRKFMTVEAKMLSEMTDEVKDALYAYEEVVKKFRGSVKNDISSAKSSASSLEENIRRMGAVYKETMTILNSDEFMGALANAEKMAMALKALAEVNMQTVNFSIGVKK